MSRASGDHRRRRHAFSLIELVLVMAIMTVLAAGLGAAVMIAGRATQAGTSAPAASLAARDVVQQIAQDVHFALDFETRTANELVFTVPDRDGDGLPEYVHYAWSGTPGDPLTYQYNSGTTVDLVDDVQQLDLRYAYRTTTGEPLPGAGAGKGLAILLVVPDSTTLSAQDLARTSMLEAMGHTVVPISATDSQGAFDLAVPNVDVAYVVEQSQSRALGTKLRDAAVGVVVEEAELHADFGFSTNRDWPSIRRTVDLVDTSHFITSPFGVGLLTIFDTDAQVVSLAGSQAGGLQVLGEHDWSGAQTGLAVIEAGDDLSGGGRAADRRVQLPWGRTGLDINELNADGRTILERSLEWAAAGTGGDDPPADANFGYETVFGTQVSGVHEIQIACQADLTEAGTVTSITAYVDCENKDIRLAIYDDAGGEPGTLLVETAAGRDGSSPRWVTLSVTDTALSAGTYWLALAFDRSGQDYYQESGGETRYRFHDAERNGFLPVWGVSDESYAITVSIYATYTPD